ncbi:MAG: PilZ domain-containing protein [Deltaproteobacteria bacterium]|nr:PilZ domain-containing protein [Deltaproteobacteria bacterium]
MDKREAVRVPVHVKARCRCAGSGIVIEGLVEDVSRSGMFLRAPKWVRPGSAAEIDLVVPGDEALRLNVEVVRVEHSDGKAGMGLRFVEPTATSRSLANFIMRQHASGR